jgi:predicted ATPase/Tfp pilus assembly protein PilF
MAHAQIMRLLALQGQWGAAQAHYHHCRDILTREIGIEPAPEIGALASEIREAGLRGTPFPPQIAVPPDNLPPSLLPFVGRDAELDALAEKLANAECRLVALLGPGGIGKTRLATESAREHAGMFRDGVFFVPLAGVSSSEYVAPAIAAALQHNLVGRQEPDKQLVDLLRGKAMLLVIDNVEHLPDATELWAEILKQAPGVKLIATSRQPLDLRACWVIDLQGLEVPAKAEAGKRLLDYSALSLFEQTASRLLPSFRVAEVGKEVLRICRLLDGIPLAIELAAAWVRELDPGEIADQIQSDLDFLASPMRDIPARHRSMRAVFAYSWRLLSPDEQHILAALSVFRGGSSPEAAWHVVAASPGQLASLAQKSLLQAVQGERYQMHELLRQFAAEKLEEQGDRARIQALHGGYYAGLLQAQEQAWQATQERAVLDAIGRELENARAAWRWAVDGAHLDEIGMSARILAQYHRIRGPFQLGQRLLSRAAERLEAAGQMRASGVTPHLLAGLYGEQAKFLLELGSYERAADLARRAIDLARQVGQDRHQAAGHVRLGEALYRQGQHEAAQEHLEQALELSRRAGSPAWEATSLRHLGNRAYFASDLETARHYYEKSANLFGQIGNRLDQAFVHHNLANISVQRGDNDHARSLLEDNIGVYRQVGAQFDEAMSLLNLAVVCRRQGEYLTALDYYRTSLETCRQVGARLGETITLLNLGSLLTYLGDHPSATGYYQRALDNYRALGDRQGEASALTSLGLVYHEMGDQAAAREYSQQSLAITRELDDPLRQANALMHLGHAFAAEAEASSRPALLEQAADAYEQVLHIRRELGQPHLEIDALAGLAHSAMLARRPEQARAYVDQILTYRQSRLADDRHGLEGSGEPFRALLVCFRVLRSQQSPHAGEVLDTAYRCLLQEAGRIGDEDLRRSFLEGVATHRQIVAAHRRMGAPHIDKPT